MSDARLFRLGYSTITWGPTPDLHEALGAIADAGWEGVEFISATPDWLGTPKRLRGLLDQYGLEPSCMLGSVSIAEDREMVLERQKRLIEYAAEIGSGLYAFIGAPRVPLRLPTDEEFKQLADVSEALIDHAAPYDITVVYLAHPRCTVESEAEQDQLLSYTDRLQICLDVSVSGLMREDPIAQIHKYRDRLAYLHMKDLGLSKFCVMGEGTGELDFGLIRETLNEVGYSGWVTGELSSYADTPAVESCYANMAHLKSVGY